MKEKTTTKTNQPTNPTKHHQTFIIYQNNVIHYFIKNLLCILFYFAPPHSLLLKAGATTLKGFPSLLTRPAISKTKTVNWSEGSSKMAQGVRTPYCSLREPQLSSRHPCDSVSGGYDSIFWPQPTVTSMCHARADSMCACTPPPKQQTSKLWQLSYSYAGLLKLSQAKDFIIKTGN